MAQLTPQKKKQLSYQRDRRNTFGNSDKAARKGIRRSKRYVNQSYRQAIHQKTKQIVGVCSIDLIEELEERAASIKRSSWRKWPDAPLGKVVERKLARRSMREGKSNKITGTTGSPERVRGQEADERLV